MENNHQLFTAKNINEILFQQKTVNGLKIIGGATYINELPEKCLSIKNISELSQIYKHERYIEFGPAVTLNSMLRIGVNFLPTVLYDALNSISNHAIRNIATLGGNILANDTRLSLIAPLIALGATLKFKSQKNTEIVPLSKFKKIPEDSVLANIRVPTEDWNIEFFKRLGPSFKISNESASFCFLAKTEKKVLINLKICFSGPFVFTSHELETKYLGTKLPLETSAIEEFLTIVETEYDEQAKSVEYSPMQKKQFLNLIAKSLHELT